MASGGDEESRLFFDKTKSFAKFDLDRRLFKGIAKMKFVYPTAIQAECIPVAMEGYAKQNKKHTYNQLYLTYPMCS